MNGMIDFASIADMREMAMNPKPFRIVLGYRGSGKTRYLINRAIKSRAKLIRRNSILSFQIDNGRLYVVDNDIVIADITDDGYTIEELEACADD